MCSPTFGKAIFIFHKAQVGNFAELGGYLYFLLFVFRADYKSELSGFKKVILSTSSLYFICSPNESFPSRLFKKTIYNLSSSEILSHYTPNLTMKKIN